MNKNKGLNRPTQFGPWPLSLQPKDEEDQEIPVKKTVSRTIDLDQFQNITYRLPKIQQAAASTNRKLALKLSHRSIEMDEKPKIVSSRSRFSSMNGSVVGFYRSNGVDRDSFKFSHSAVLHREDNSTLSSYPQIIPSASMVQQKTIISKRNRLINYESAKKRSLLHYIREVTNKKELMKLYLQVRAFK